jgi:acyl dehydratase
MSVYRVTARNFSTASDNRMHSDTIAQDYGFKGALVPGVAVYGHLCKPLVSKFGSQWLNESHSALRLIKPAYNGDELTIRLLEEANNTFRVTCHNQEDTLLAEIISTPAKTLDEDLGLIGPPISTSKTEIKWDNVIVKEVFATQDWALDGAENARYCEEIGDKDPIYAEHVHPHFILALANQCLVEAYDMPAWIHVSSETNHRAALMVGDEISCKSVVKAKFERKGHQFITIHATFWRNKRITTDILHTAIFRIAK